MAISHTTTGRNMAMDRLTKARKLRYQPPHSRQQTCSSTPSPQATTALHYATHTYGHQPPHAGQQIWPSTTAANLVNHIENAHKYHHELSTLQYEDWKYGHESHQQAADMATNYFTTTSSTVSTTWQSRQIRSSTTSQRPQISSSTTTILERK